MGKGASFDVSIPTGNFLHAMDVYRPLDAQDDAHGGFPGFSATPIMNSIPCLFVPKSAKEEDTMGRMIMAVTHDIFTATRIIDADGTELDRDWLIKFNGRKFLVQFVINQGELDLLWVITTKEFR